MSTGCPTRVTVEFSATVTRLLAHTPSCQYKGSKYKKTWIDWDGIIGVGAHSALKRPVQQNFTAVKNETAREAAYIAKVLRGGDTVETGFNVTAKLWGIGHPIDLALVNGTDRNPYLLPPKSLMDLPSYRWNHMRTFWHGPYAIQSNRFPAFPRTKKLLGVTADT
ncbi:Polyketide synthase [Emericellopsis cladophorae]|uniref:Polyketide synthase n=1 Tax=Emericellopsis cladophorae TaxID=2686198 RepID=A0A9Q0BF40_9HYPO|nr:Polyketide synthase [Emericellopsis cladophorae]KAI6781894.1 Polyketide synthase [Emericellopsis cladophorae]